MRQTTNDVRLLPACSPTPDGCLLGHEQYALLVTPKGTGFSSAGGYALTDWSGDRVSDAEGLFIFLRDPAGGDAWTPGHHPAGPDGPEPRASWRPGVLTLERDHDGLAARLEIAVAPGQTLELRRLTLRNPGDRPRRIEITSLADVVLNDPAAHASHPAFSKLFIQTEFDGAHRALLVRRRPRANDERHPCLFHAVTGDEPLEIETDRARFYDRGRPTLPPRALAQGGPLSGTVGNVLDPIVSLRIVVDIPPGGAVTRTFLLGVADTAETARARIVGYGAPIAVEDEFAAAQRNAEASLARLDLAPTAARELDRLATALLYGHPDLRAAAEVSTRAAGSPGDLARVGLNPRCALALLTADAAADDALLRRFGQAAAYWRAAGAPIDAVAVAPAARGTLAGAACALVDPAGATPADLDRVAALARLVIASAWPDPAAQSAARTAPVASALPAAAPTPPAAPTELAAFNGYGGFAENGAEYVIRIGRAPDGALRLPPRPWINVLANEEFGCLISETGAGYTWSRNSREHRLTPWYNDALLDPHGEAFYIRDDESGAFWSPLPGPAPGAGDYEVRHGLGYSVFRHAGGGLAQETRVVVARQDSVRIATITLRNPGPAPRRVTLFAASRLVLGGTPAESGRSVVTAAVAERPGALLAWNRLADEFSACVAFAAVVTSSTPTALRVSGDRAEFLGREGNPAAPAALRPGAQLDGATGPGRDAGFHQEVGLIVPAGGQASVAFLLGAGRDAADAQALMARYATPAALAAADKLVCDFWRTGVSGVRIQTPAKELDWMVNAWLPYQTLSCRIWGRSAFYQSGGAYGFRDQLQDAASLVALWPELTRAQILRNAAHQFVEGDVLHWWHPPLGRGLRTRFADDLIWLPYLATYYARTTGDWGIFDTAAPFVTARPLAPGEDEVYLLATDSGTSADIYDHCCRALDRSLTKGAHGLPLFGTGDWNDGMNRVGREGRGESVWMAFFLYETLGRFLNVCARRGDTARVERYTAYRADLRLAVNAGGWDGAWYRRGYYDDGTPLGSHSNDECRIDALAQAWAVISGAAPPERAAQAMAAAEAQLISEPEQLIRLLAPPFENTPHDPGYIKGYVPGVRENGGQYTHAALWVVKALARLGRRERAAKLLTMLSPVAHSRTPEQVAVYQVEPFVVAADVYGAPPHVGRGGWTWYTGSAGWMYRVALESVLGFRVIEGKTLTLAPCIPDEWPEFRIDYRVPGHPARYAIEVRNPQRRAERILSATLDGQPVTLRDGVAQVPLEAAEGSHRIIVNMGPRE